MRYTQGLTRARANKLFNAGVGAHALPCTQPSILIWRVQKLPKQGELWQAAASDPMSPPLISRPSSEEVFNTHSLVQS